MLTPFNEHILSKMYLLPIHDVIHNLISTEPSLIVPNKKLQCTWCQAYIKLWQINNTKKEQNTVRSRDSTVSICS